MRRKIVTIVSVIVLGLVCAALAIFVTLFLRKPGILDLHRQLEIGMNRQQVEEIVGQPIMPPNEISPEEIQA